MAKRSSSSKTAAIAGTLAGLLAAGLGAYYLQQQRDESARPAQPASASSAPATSAAPDAARSREQAIAALMALPELQAWSERIEKSSGGKLRGALIEYDPKPRDINGKSYYQLSFIENGSDAALRWESFLVSYSDGEILVDDDLSGEVLTLDRWRKEKKPMQRGADGQ